ncbi:MAG: hypothetical protein H3C64_03050 [Candidatus Kuenenia stuttgartiensis]|uniref:hypothetical protein n=1 Tax=Candidatus Kuenenia TaxID=380738 RepID=UPI0012FF3AA0|nr:hypothetical protein [Candidatus Kuenenia stuttgartiensis]MBW7941381.1 hypothetical protein [Candidatus Kuenenia stuttgartiensis]
MATIYFFFGGLPFDNAINLFFYKRLATARSAGFCILTYAVYYCIIIAFHLI